MRGFGDTLYDVTPDDQRFVMLRIGDRENAVASELILVENWVEELRQRSPRGGQEGSPWSWESCWATFGFAGRFLMLPLSLPACAG